MLIEKGKDQKLINDLVQPYAHVSLLRKHIMEPD